METPSRYFNFIHMYLHDCEVTEKHKGGSVFYYVGGSFMEHSYMRTFVFSEKVEEEQRFNTIADSIAKFVSAILVGVGEKGRPLVE